MKQKRKRQSPVVDAWVRPPPPKIECEKELVRWVGEMMLATMPPMPRPRIRRTQHR